MQIPAVKGYMPLNVTLRSQVCDEQGVGHWPMWKRFDSVKDIVDQYVDEPYRDFFALPLLDTDKQKSEEYFFWYTPRRDTAFCRLSMAGDDHDHYKTLLDKTLAHYHSVVEKLKSEGKYEDANFLQLSLKYAGESEDNVYCGGNCVVATVWGMRPRQGQSLEESKLVHELFPETEMHDVVFDLGDRGETSSPTQLRKSHGSTIYDYQIPKVMAIEGYDFIGWDSNPLGLKVTDNLLFTAQYQKKAIPIAPKVKEIPQLHHVRFLTPDKQIISELDVEHGKRIASELIPMLPSVNGVICSAWDGDPTNDIIREERDYMAIGPSSPPKELHTVRFLTPDKKVMAQFQVEHGANLSLSQVPMLPVIDGTSCSSWSPNPLEEKITSDRDFVAIMDKPIGVVDDGRSGLWGWGSGCLNWLLALLLLGLIGLLLWYLLGDHNIDFCRQDCDCSCRECVVDTYPIKPTPSPKDTPKIINNPEEVPKPTANCGVHFSGWFLSDRNEYPWRDCSQIFEEEEFGEYVGQGYYPYNTKILPKSMRHSFDAVAVGKGTQLIIYSKPNFEGRIVLNVKGPILIENVVQKGNYDKLMTYTFSDELQELFPPERRQWSSENMHDWAYGSCKIICEQ